MNVHTTTQYTMLPKNNKLFQFIFQNPYLPQSKQVHENKTLTFLMFSMCHTCHKFYSPSDFLPLTMLLSTTKFKTHKQINKNYRPVVIHTLTEYLKNLLQFDSDPESIIERIFVCSFWVLELIIQKLMAYPIFFIKHSFSSNKLAKLKPIFSNQFMIRWLQPVKLEIVWAQGLHLWNWWRWKLLHWEFFLLLHLLHTVTVHRLGKLGIQCPVHDEYRLQNRNKIRWMVTEWKT